MKKILLILACLLIASSAGAATTSLVLNIDSGAKVLKIGSSGKAVMSLQAYLANQGLYNKAVDGKFGPGTKAALITYQKLAGLVPDGSAGPFTFKFMNIYPGMKLSTANSATINYLRSLYQTQNQNASKTALNLTASQALNKVLAVPSKPVVLALANPTSGQGSGTSTNSNQQSSATQNPNASALSINQNTGLGQTSTQSSQSITLNNTQSTTQNSLSSNNSASSAPVYYLNNNNTINTTSTPWWQANTTTTNYNDPNASIPLSGYPFEFKISADAIFTLYAYKLGANSKVADLQPICKNITSTVYGVPAWKNYKKCPKFTLPQDYNLALAVADNGVTAGAWIGRLEIVGNKYYSQDYAWRYSLSKSTAPAATKDFTNSQIINEINTDTFGPTEVIGYYGVDPWGIFIDDENDRSFDDAAWVKAVDPGLKKFAIYTLQNGGVATPVVSSSVDLKANGEDVLSVDSGSSFDLSWDTDNVTSCSGASSPVKPSWNVSHSITGGSVNIDNLITKTTFTINCTNSSGGTVSDSVVVDIKPTVELASSTNTNGTTKLTWVSTNATACKSSGGSTGWATANYSRPANGNWSTAAVLTNNTTFEITCSGSGGSVSDSVSVAVASPTIDSFTANSTTINTGGSVTLNWSTQNTSSCSATSSPANTSWSGAKNLTGSTTISNLNSTTTFTLTCNLGTQQTSSSVVVNVQAVPVSVSVSTNKIVVDTTSSSKKAPISWKITGINNLSVCSKSGNWSGSITSANSTENTPDLTTPGMYTYTITCNGVSDSVTVQATNTEMVRLVSNTTSTIGGGVIKLGWGSKLPTGKNCKLTYTTLNQLTPDQTNILNTYWSSAGFNAGQNVSTKIVALPSSNNEYTFTVTCQKDSNTPPGEVSSSVTVSTSAPSVDNPTVVEIVAVASYDPFNLSHHYTVNLTWPELVKFNPAMTSGNQLCIDINNASNGGSNVANLCSAVAYDTFPQSQYHFEGDIMNSPTSIYAANGSISLNGVDLSSYASNNPANLVLPEFTVIVN